MTHDPRTMMRASMKKTRLHVSYKGGEHDQSLTGFWSHVDRRGAYVTSVNNGSYTTVVDVSGSGGIVSGIIGPCDGSNSVTDQDYKITVDGVESIISIHRNNFQSTFIGCLAQSNYISDSAAAVRPFWYYDGDELSSDESVLDLESGMSVDMFILPPSLAASAFSTGPALGFTDSLKVEMQSNAANGASVQAYGGVVYMTL